jgi:cobalt-zinc-cadmium efflux system outer membrane protein
MMRNTCSLFVLLICAGASGCARFHSQALAPEQTATDFANRSLSDPGLRAFIETNLHSPAGVWPLTQWDLTNLVFAAFYYHPDLDVARAKWAGVQASRITAGARPNPTLTVTPGYDTTTSIPSPWIPFGTIDIPIETAGKRRYRIGEATQLSEAARLKIASAAWQVRSQVRRSLLDVYVARENERLLTEQQSIQAENVRLLEQQYQAGAVSAFEWTQSRIAANSTRLALREAERQSAQARVQLAQAIGIATTALDGVELSFAGLSRLPDDLPAAEVRRQALLRRADILGALAEYAASQSALQLEIARQYPDVHLGPGYQYDQGDNKWSLGLTVTLPLLNQNQGPIAEARAKRAEAAASFNALQARVLAELDGAVAAYRTALHKQTDAAGLLVELEQQEKRARAMLELGEISKSELAGLRLQLSASALARLEAVSRSQQALGLLEDALQTPVGLSDAVWEVSPRVPESITTNRHP